MRIAIYIRVSTEDQAKEGYSLEVQRESSPDFFEIKAGRMEYPPQICCCKSMRGGRLESFATREGLEIFKIYQDDSISGYSAERPALKQLLKDGKMQRFDI